MLGSIRHQVRINRPADEVWSLVGDPARIPEWFDGIVACTVDGDRRTVTTATGIDMPEEILVHDDRQRRFQYRVDVGLFTYHRGTIDVIDLGDGTCLATYATDADPRAMALVVGGASKAALEHVKALVEAGPDDTSSEGTT